MEFEERFQEGAGCAREGRQVEAWEEWNWWCKLSLVREGGVAGGGEWLDGRNAEGRENAKEIVEVF